MSRILFAAKHCAQADDYLKAAICRSRGEPSTNEMEEKQINKINK